MAGLLDSITEDQLLGGLLGAGAASGAKGNFLSRFAAGIGAGERFNQGRRDEARQRSQDEMRAEYQKLMNMKMQRDAQQQEAAAAQGSANTDAVRGSLGQFDPGQFFQQNPKADLSGLEQAVKLNQMITPKQSEFSTAPQYDQNGRAFILSKDGQIKYLDGVKARDKLISEDLGGKKGFRTEYSPNMLGMADKFQTPDSIAGNATTQRGQNMTNDRAREFNAIGQETNRIMAGEKRAEKDLAKAGQLASFDVMLGSLDRLAKHPGLPRSVGIAGAFPTMPGSESANFQAELDTFQSQAFLPMVSQLKGMGALSDAEGKKLTAAVGALNPKMGEKAFRESVDRITSDMEAARSRMAGQVASSAPTRPAQVMQALPPAQAHKGRLVRDVTTGKMLRSNGISWAEVK